MFPMPCTGGLKARAAMAGMSLSDYLLAEIKEIAERPTLRELRQRLHGRKQVSADEAADISSCDWLSQPILLIRARHGSVR